MKKEIKNVCKFDPLPMAVCVSVRTKPENKKNTIIIFLVYCKGEMGCKGAISQGQEVALRRYFRPDAALL